ncbi:MAG: acyclic terpene utilization AtuA family protein [Alphaproteobacteria bacterium]
MAAEKTIRIGGGAGFWGDSEAGPAQLVESGGIDYLVLDYLAEITMSILSRARAKDPNLGYATDFVSLVMARLLPKIAAQNIKVVTNAGGVNPQACCAALEKEIAKAGVKLKVAAVLGDDLAPLADALRAEGTREMYAGSAMPAKLWSINAYLGARPIQAALAAGADVVITGRSVDSALALGPLMHEFGWVDGDYDLLASGSLAGHVIECGAQATGGIFTDWEQVEGWDRMGFPIVECKRDGSFVVTKPADTGGLVSPATVAEQIVYEIGDPRGYVLPDVICDFSRVQLKQAGPDRVSVMGAKGRVPTPTYKVSATYHDGFRATTTLMIGGIDAARKARRVGEAILARTRRMFRERNFGDYRATSIEVLGAEDTYGRHARTPDVREVVLKIAVHHDSKDALELFSREIAPSATAMAQGTTGFGAGRPSPTPLIRLFSCLVDKSRVPVSFVMDGTSTPVAVTTTGEALAAPPPDPVIQAPSVAGDGNTVVPLIALAHGRSGDKGDKANIGILARRSEFLPYIRVALTEDAVREYFAHIVQGRVERFEIPGLNGFNFLLHEALGGGGIASLRYDPQGKAFAQMLLDFPVPVPAAWLRPGGLLTEAAA